MASPFKTDLVDFEQPKNALKNVSVLFFIALVPNFPSSNSVAEQQWPLFAVACYDKFKSLTTFPRGFVTHSTPHTAMMGGTSAGCCFNPRDKGS